VIRAQAAINFFFQKVQNLKVSEEISDEGQTWRYDFSASLVRDQMRFLIETRDRALAMLGALHAPLDSWVSLVAERDLIAARYLEPYVEEVGAMVPYAGLGGADSGALDYRFGTIG
jgi:hypothetical protein